MEVFQVYRLPKDLCYIKPIDTQIVHQGQRINKIAYKTWFKK